MGHRPKIRTNRRGEADQDSCRHDTLSRHPIHDRLRDSGVPGGDTSASGCTAIGRPSRAHDRGRCARRGRERACRSRAARRAPIARTLSDMWLLPFPSPQRSRCRRDPGVAGRWEDADVSVPSGSGGHPASGSEKDVPASPHPIENGFAIQAGRPCGGDKLPGVRGIDSTVSRWLRTGWARRMRTKPAMLGLLAAGNSRVGLRKKDGRQRRPFSAY